MQLAASGLLDHGSNNCLRDVQHNLELPTGESSNLSGLTKESGLHVLRLVFVLLSMAVWVYRYLLSTVKTLLVDRQCLFVKACCLCMLSHAALQGLYVFGADRDASADN